MQRAHQHISDHCFMQLFFKSDRGGKCYKQKPHKHPRGGGVHNRPAMSQVTKRQPPKWGNYQTGQTTVVLQEGGLEGAPSHAVSQQDCWL